MPLPPLRRAPLLTLLGLASTAGAQVPDTDGDGVPDTEDRCPDEKEDVNGYNDGDGCPDQRVLELLTPKPTTPNETPSLLIPKPVPGPKPVAPKPRAPLVVPTPQDTLTCTGEVTRFDSLLGARFRCDGESTSWYVVEGVGMDFPQGFQLGTRGTIVLKRHGVDKTLLVSLRTPDGRVLEPQPEAPDDGCFITTAVARRQGLPDDCRELRVLRAFRDTALGREHPDVQAYYAAAPPS
ncbi:MAG: hypothetical protein KC656_00560 [Myxococcales bacterium]|nr:hypothetical protein [Myxococcales bacterium]